MARGKEIAARHAREPYSNFEDRLELLARYCDIRRPSMAWGSSDIYRDVFTVERIDKNMVAKINGETVAAEVHGPAYPTEQFIAQCVLAVGALIPPDWVPDYSRETQHKMDERKRRDAARAHVIDWKKYPNGI